MKPLLLHSIGSLSKLFLQLLTVVFVLVFLRSHQLKLDFQILNFLLSLLQLLEQICFSFFDVFHFLLNGAAARVCCSAKNIFVMNNRTVRKRSGTLKRGTCL